MTRVSDLAITSLDVVKVYDLAGTPLFILDELQDTTIANTQEKEDITGKGGRKLTSLKRNKGVTVSGNNGMVSAGLLELQTGGTFETRESTPVAWTDYLVVNENKAETLYKAVGTTGKEIEAVYVRNTDGTAGAKLEQGADVADGVYTYNPDTKELEFAEGAIPDGTEIVVFYTRHVAGDVLTNESDVYSKTATLYIDATAEDKCGSIYHVQIYIPKADFNGEFDFSMGDSQSVHAWEAESLAGSNCRGAGASAGALWTYTVFGINAEDADVNP